MEVPISEDEGVLMEWAPFTDLINQIPLKIQSGLFAQDLSLTCIDVTNEYLALGTNVGLVFWYGRQKGDLQRLRCEVTNSTITFVKIVSTVDFMVAAGNKLGQVTVFQIPKTHPDSLPESLKPKVARQVERYTVGGLHHSEITHIEWSKNGMRLFSGDKNGLVVMTEIDFYMHLCKSSEIINETYEIVQISYYQNYLLVSSVYRSIICHKKDVKWDVCQVGKRDRKSLCNLGGVFQYNYEKPNDVNVYCARPGLRIWTSDRQGNVLQTLLFKEAIGNPCSHVELLNPAQKKSVKSNKEIHFGPMHIFKEKYLVSHNDEQLYVINPETLICIATIDNVRRILSVATNKDEIFILEGDRSLIRVAYSPDFQVDKAEENLMTKSLTNPVQLAVNTIKELASLQSQMHLSDLVDSCDSIIRESSASFNISPSVAAAEECFELPTVRDLPSDINTNMLDKLVHNFMGDKDGVFDEQSCINFDANPFKNRTKSLDQSKDKKLKKYDLISEKEFNDDILYKSKKKKRSNIINLDGNHTDKSIRSKDNSVEKLATANLIKLDSSNLKPLLGISNIKNSLSPDNMSPESIEKEIQAKEEILAKVLDLEPVTLSAIRTPSPEILFFNTEISVPCAKSNFTSYPKSDTVSIKLSPTKINSPVKNKGFAANKVTPSVPLEPPKCVSIPNTWNLKEIKLDISQNSEFPNGKRDIERRFHRKVSENEDLDGWELV